MPNLKLHQLRVAAVASLICDNLKRPVNKNDVTLACLFHDMGNILKMNLGTFPPFLEPEGLEYWENVKSEFLEQYGNNAHKANVVIAKKIGLDSTVIDLIDGISFSNIEKIVANNSFEQKVCEYADTRVGPHGVLPLKGRLREARERYAAANSDKIYYTEEGFRALVQHAEEIENQVFTECRIKPEDISDVTVGPLMEELRNYPVA